MGQRRINRSRIQRDELRQRAAARQEERNKRTPAQQINVLDRRLGDSLGAQKERKRLESLTNVS
jgi:hypothetical protein